MRTLDVTDFPGPAEFPLPTLKPGMCLVLCTDKGPGGPCGQSMNITCPWAGLVIFPNEDAAREHLDKNLFRRGTRQDVRLFVIGSWGSGRFFIVDKTED